jgi:hypothetical protein
MTMKKYRRVAGLVTAGFGLVSCVANAQDLFAYPPQGRTPAQQQQNQYECHQWAVAQTGFDPVQFAAQGTTTAPTSAVTAATEKPAATQGKSGRAAVGGAAQGALIAEASGGDAGTGAASGAAAGLLRSRIAERKAAAEKAAAQAQSQTLAQQSAAQQQSAKAKEVEARQQAYQRARGTCFRARGYTVSEA